jgi:pimeloyl-ACP methyl ester carboxylesterase
LLPAALVLAGALLAACSAPVAGSPSIGTSTGPARSSTSPPTAQSGTGTPPSGTSAAGVAPVPAGLESFYRQQLDWGSCADLATSDDTKIYRAPSLQCADLVVPLSYDDPTGPTITLKVLRRPATDPAKRIGSVITNPGGPGASGVENAAYIGGFGLAKTINEGFDLIGFDPRGVGFSAPLIECQTDAERDATRAATVRTRNPEEVQAANTLAQQLAQGCATMSGPPSGIDGNTFLANVGTANVAKDLDVLRGAVGDRQLTYTGWSYGTSIGTEYARQFPQNVRAMILDGAIDPNQDPVNEDVDQTAGFQQAFDDYAAWCASPQEVAKHPCPLGLDSTQSTAIYQALVRPLLDNPLPLTDGRVITFNDAVTGTFSALYSETLWPNLSDALTALGRGEGDGLMALADSYLGRDADGHYGNLQDAFLAITCIDGSRPDPAKDPGLAEKRAAAAPFMASGDPPAAVTDPCGFWPVPTTSLQPVNGIPGLPTVLVISTTHDPATPYESGVNLADDIGARLLTVNGTNHTAYLGTGNQCVDQIGNDYLINLALPAGGITC